MSTATVGTRYQVVIPAQVRRQVDLKPRDKVSVEVENGAIVVRPIDARRFRGIGKGTRATSDPVGYVRELRAEWGRDA